jgi:hypothetical protein
MIGKLIGGGSFMSAVAQRKSKIVLGPELNGTLMTPEEFDAVEEYDDNYVHTAVPKGHWDRGKYQGSPRRSSATSPFSERMYSRPPDTTGTVHVKVPLSKT